MDAAQDIKSRLDIADLIGEYLSLKPAGSGAFKALCPFHQEKTPSFYVSRPRQSWHCFGCDQGGDHFTFVERMEGMEFREVLEFLAQKTGVVLPKFDGAQSSLRKRLYEVNELAMRFFRSVLENLPQAEHARAYLKKRGVDDLTADLFKLGYAPAEWTALADALVQKGVSADEMLKAGLVAKRDSGGVYDRFRNRLMFPIADVHGNIVGFTGRVLSDDKNPSTSSGHGEAKYVNTLETQIYRKSAILYGLDKAKGEIRRQDLAVIVEGNMDVIGSHQFGVTNVVASSGTALTSEQLALLRRFTTNLAIAFDQDAAGVAATVRGLDLARAMDFSLRIITLPPDAGKDPDEAVRKDPQIWKDAIKKAMSVMEWIYAQAFRGRRADQPEDKKLIARSVLMEIKRIADPVERDHWLKRLARDLAISEDALKEAMKRTPNEASIPHPVNVIQSSIPPKKTDTREHAFERRLLAALLYQPRISSDIIRLYDLKAHEFEDTMLSGLYETLRGEYSVGEQSPMTPDSYSGTSIRPPVSLTPDETKLFHELAFLAEREFEGQSVEQIKRELEQTIGLFREGRKGRERKRLEQSMREAERLGQTDIITQLLKEFDQWK